MLSGEGARQHIDTLSPQNPIGPPKNGPIFICRNLEKNSYVKNSKKTSKGVQKKMPHLDVTYYDARE
jgi:hypothetical protein